MPESKHSPFLAIILIIFFVVVFYDCLMHGNYFAFWIGGVDTAIHEGGHLFFWLFGYKSLGVAGGTIMQLFLPILIGVGFYFQRDFLWISVIFGWLGINFFDIARYAGDAIEGRLPLLMLFGKWLTYEHDWSYMLRASGLLYHTALVAQIFYITAIVCFCIFFLGALSTIVLDWMQKRRESNYF